MARANGFGSFTQAEYARRLAGVRLDDFGTISESFIVTDRGGEHLCDVAHELIVIG
ncbi:hypothetical protein [Mesorhizobium sp. M9A.F.Ca.ET.002.03.1.2]|uniref:hypothetical protein n=1 Tax=Mesorhizobium sp. M9A.F.Ca.ET.002.03.1.2 TaxID=2493668 RepID=UPI001677D028|nr:hypothetical protein [Mesorhizobium sp. M9A.F.Ca.ET.002.03.1.2]